MPDHTERERAARGRIARGMEKSSCDGACTEWCGICEDIDAYRAAVRSAVLAEVRAKVEGMRIARYNESVVREGVKLTDTVYFAIEPEGDWIRYEDFAAVLSALTALEATDADA